MLYRRTILLLIIFAPFLSSANAADGTTWKAGTAKIIITPATPIWMSGYGGRTRPAEGKLHDLWIKVLVLVDGEGHRAVVLSSDLLGIPQSIYNNTCATLKKKYGLERAQIMLNCSHSHCTPVLRGALYDVYPIEREHIDAINNYSDDLEKKIVATIGKAFSNLEPVRLSAGNGRADFGVNRRNNLEPDVPDLRKKNALRGPVDHSVPVLAVHSVDGTLKAVVFGYACHNTTVSFYKWCGDYAGFAQIALEKKHPNAVAMFYMGCGADQNPLPRRTVELCSQYGRKLATAVDEVLTKPMTPLKPTLQTELELVTLNLGAEPTREELTKMTAGKRRSYIQRWASRLLKQMDTGKPFIRTYPYPVQVWMLGGQQIWITLGGEVVVDYSLGFKKQYGQNTWVAGYCNDVMCYIPSLRVLEEDVPPRASSRWGYEGNRSMIVYGMPAHRWADDIELLISASVQRQVKTLQKTAQ